MNINMSITEKEVKRMMPELPNQIVCNISFAITTAQKISATEIQLNYEFAIEYHEYETPKFATIATIKYKGYARIVADDQTIYDIIDRYHRHVPPPPFLAQSILSYLTAESIMDARSIGLPLPISQLHIEGGMQ